MLTGSDHLSQRFLLFFVDVPHLLEHVDAHPPQPHGIAYGRWSFAEFTEVYQIEYDFEAKVEAEFSQMIDTVTAVPAV